MSNPKIPDIQGITRLTPLEMNAVHFDKRHTVLSPDILSGLANAKKATKLKDRNAVNDGKT